MAGDIAQALWAPSVVAVGDRIVGQDVTSGLHVEGVVVEVVGPIRTPDCGGYRYRVDSGDVSPVTGEPMTRIVYAERWVR
jgi:hypothetical protein